MEETVRIYNSFEEADAAESEYRQQLTPTERMAIFFAIRERAFPGASEQGLERVCRVLKLGES